VVTLKGIPDATVARLPVYLRALNQLADQQIDTISSGALA
jgi:redox-sensing transcriptional repressor